MDGVKPIMFSPPMVRAILEGRKTQTRRVIKRLTRIGAVTEFQPSNTRGYDWTFRNKRMLWNDLTNDELLVRAPYRVGDVLWVREGVWCYEHTGWTKNRQLRWPKFKDDNAGREWFDKACSYQADDPSPSDSPVGLLNKMFAPRWASRIRLEVTAVRAERLQEISEADAEHEGVELDHYYCDESGGEFGHRCDPIGRFRELWDSIAKTGNGWDDNPYVWVYTFRRIKP